MELEMTTDEALAFADEWAKGLTLYPGAQGWRVVCLLLAAEVRRLREHAITLANTEALAERERCAKLCEGFYNHEAKDCAEAIRAQQP